MRFISVDWNVKVSNKMFSKLLSPAHWKCLWADISKLQKQLDLTYKRAARERMGFWFDSASARARLGVGYKLNSHNLSCAADAN